MALKHVCGTETAESTKYGRVYTIKKMANLKDYLEWHMTTRIKKVVDILLCISVLHVKPCKNQLSKKNIC